MSDHGDKDIDVTEPTSSPSPDQPAPAAPPAAPFASPAPASAHNVADALFGPSTQTANAIDPTTLPTITTASLREALSDAGVIDDRAVVSLLGPDRKSAKIDRFELTLVQNNVLSVNTLAEYKARVSGRTAFELQSYSAVPVLPVDVARTTGALVVSRTPSAVAFVLDDPVAVERVAAALGSRNFEIWTITAPTFVRLFKELYTGEVAQNLPAVPDIYGVLDAMIEDGSSDLHLGVGEPPILRSSGDLMRLETQPVDQEWMKRSIEALTGDVGMHAVETRWDADAGFQYGIHKFRINAGADDRGYTLAIRRLSTEVPTMDKLNLPPAIRAFAELERGLVLVTGPTGSGKSTTLAAILSHIGVSQARHMITLEDPIEYKIPHRKGRVQQRELGKSFTSFSDGIRQSLRQDPDVVLVGEARDLETIRAAVTAAETGALVFATLHTYDAASTLGRIISQFSEGEQNQIRAQLAYVLKGVVSQTLVRSNTGGRVAAFEILVGTPAVSNNLRKPEGVANLRQVIVTGAGDGMQTLEFHLAQLVKRGLISQADAEFKARDTQEFYQYLNAGE